MRAEDSKHESTRLAGRAMTRAARKVLADAVEHNKPIPLWNGSEVVWKVPREELADLDREALQPAQQQG